ncbi:InlB B-repeat-containing protein, partial [Methanimicrococcus blatticola]
NDMPSYKLADPVRADENGISYTFAGWTPEIVAVTEDAVYTASYDESLIDYTVTWKDYDGTELDVEIYNFNDMPSYKLADPVRADENGISYTFAGWTPEIVAVTEDAVYTASYDESLIDYTVTWKDYDGTELDVEIYNFNDMPSYKLADPVRADENGISYTFAGWTPEIVAVTEDAVYTASYDETQNRFTVSYLSDVGENAAHIDSDVLGEYLVKSCVDVGISKEGYRLHCWIVDPDGKAIENTCQPGATLDVDCHVTLTAMWVEENYTVTYKPGEGGVGGITVPDFNYGDTHNILSKDAAGVSKVGYNFSYWVNEDPSDTKKYRTPEQITITENLTLVAVWDASNCYVVTYYPGDGTYNGPGLGYADNMVEYDSSYQVKSPTNVNIEAPDLYVFDYWMDLSDRTGDTRYQPADLVTIKENLNLKAMWKLDDGSFKVTYLSGEGIGGSYSDTLYYSDSEYTVRSPYDAPLNFLPLDESCSFSHWLASDGVTTYSPDQLLTIGAHLTGDETLTAVWTTACNSVTYVSGDYGSGWYPDKTPVVGEDYTVLTLEQTGIVSTNDDYVFSTWRESNTDNIFNPGSKFEFVSSKTLTAVWVPKTGYTVTYEPGAGIGTAQTDGGLDYNVDYVVKSEKDVSFTAQDGYFFSGWVAGNGTPFAVSDIITIKENVTLTAVWAPDERCKVVVYAPGDFGIGDPDSRDVGYGLDHIVLSTEDFGFTAKEGYVFSHWEDTSQAIFNPGDRIGVATDMYLTAVWTPEIAKFTVTYLDDLEGNVVYTDSTPATDAYAILTVGELGLTAEFYEVSHWVDVTEGFAGSTYAKDDTMIVNGNVVLAPYWESVCHRVYYFNDISVADQFEEGVSKLEYATAHKFRLTHDQDYVVLDQTAANVYNQGASFSHWVDQNGNEIPAGGTIKIDKIETYLFAVWDSQGDIEVTFDATTGEFADGHTRKSTLVNSGEYLTVPEVPSKDGAEVVYWVTADNRIWDFENFIVQEPDFTLYAVWSDELMRVVTFDANSSVFILGNIGNELNQYSIVVKSGETILEPEEYSSKSFGYVMPDDTVSVTWVGTDGKAWNFDDPVTESMTLKANWNYEKSGSPGPKTGGSGSSYGSGSITVPEKPIDPLPEEEPAEPAEGFVKEDENVKRMGFFESFIFFILSFFR